MPWNVITSIVPLADWEEIPVVIFGDALIRVQHFWDGDGAFPGRAYLTVVMQFTDGVRHGFRRLYPYKEQSSFEFKIPEQRKSAGDFMFKIYARLGSRSYYVVDSNWRVELSLFETGNEPLPMPESTPEQIETNPTIIYNAN